MKAAIWFWFVALAGGVCFALSETPDEPLLKLFWAALGALALLEAGELIERRRHDRLGCRRRPR